MTSQGNNKNLECETLHSTNDLVFQQDNVRVDKIQGEDLHYTKKRLKRPHKQKQHVDFVWIQILKKQL